MHGAPENFAADLCRPQRRVAGLHGRQVAARYICRRILSGCLRAGGHLPEEPAVTILWSGREGAMMLAFVRALSRPENRYVA